MSMSLAFDRVKSGKHNVYYINGSKIEQIGEINKKKNKKWIISDVDNFEPIQASSLHNAKEYFYTKYWNQLNRKEDEIEILR